MFANLTDRLSRVVKGLRGQARLSEDNIAEALREVRVALLEADVALPVVRELVDAVRVRAVGQEVLDTLTPGQALVRVVRDELTRLMGERAEPLVFNVEPPAVILLAGLQGSGKTTTAAKLARHLRERDRKSVLLTSCDVYRPAAIDQLEILAGEVGADFHRGATGAGVDAIAAGAVAEARRRLRDVVIVDTAGRLSIDAQMMAEISRLHAQLKPVETLFVVDAMMGQDAVQTARAFNEAVALTGIVLTKADGDARGGAALSVRQVTGQPIKFVGIGEKTQALEIFHPDRMAARILGMGDVLGLIEDVERKVDHDKAAALATKIGKGRDFDLEDFRTQLDEMRNMGGLKELVGKLPGMNELPAQVANQLNDRELVKFAAIIDSMTAQERRFPAVVKASRKQRIARGSGTEIQDVNRLLKQFGHMQKMMKKISKKGGLAKLMRGMRANMPRGVRF
ncbi:MAG: signal recognition particle protein [Gammaproteobacteria bacterium]|nr:signal recognition particle protein [Gammaproteobacteria bacterium]